MASAEVFLLIANTTDLREERYYCMIRVLSVSFVKVFLDPLFVKMNFPPQKHLAAVFFITTHKRRHWKTLT